VQELCHKEAGQTAILTVVLRQLWPPFTASQRSEAPATANSCCWPADAEQWRLCQREQIRICSRK